MPTFPLPIGLDITGSWEPPNACKNPVLIHQVDVEIQYFFSSKIFNLLKHRREVISIQEHEFLHQVLGE